MKGGKGREGKERDPKNNENSSPKWRLGGEGERSGKKSKKGRDGKIGIGGEGVHLADRGGLPRKNPPSLHDACGALLRKGLGCFADLGGARVPRRCWISCSLMCSWFFLGCSLVFLVFPWVVLSQSLVFPCFVPRLFLGFSLVVP